MIQILELFGGIGSPRCALRNIGIPVKAIDYVEIDEKAVRSYNAMFADELPYKTQSVVGWNLKPDILIHGSPCQDFSIAGHQGKATAEAGRINRGKGADKGSGTRSSLMWETIHIIEQMGEWKPKYVIWENVKNVLSRYMRVNFNLYLSEMERLGYSRCNRKERNTTGNSNRGLCFYNYRKAGQNASTGNRYGRRALQIPYRT